MGVISRDDVSESIYSLLNTDDHHPKFPPPIIFVDGAALVDAGGPLMNVPLLSMILLT